MRIEELGERYRALDRRLEVRGEEAIDTSCLIAFAYEHPDQPETVTIETEEFTAVCPWTGLPDFGRLVIEYQPRDRVIELKSLKYYLLSYRDVGIVQEHACARILKDLVALVRPRWMRVTLEYRVRGGIRTTVTAEHREK